MHISSCITAATIMLAVSSASWADITLLESDELNASMYGWLGANYAIGEDDSEITDGWSRVGFKFSRPLTDGWQASAQFEWGLELTDRGSRSIKFGDGLKSDGSSDDPIWTRQGILGVHHDQWGAITVGKQWSVFYDVSGVVDLYVHLDSHSGGAYNFGTDGGISGTGRADKSIQYRNQWGDFQLGLQYQAQNEEINTDESTINAAFEDGMGISLRYTLTDIATFGIAMNTTEISVDGFSSLDDEVIAFSASHGSISEAGFNAAITAAVSENHETDDVGNVIDTRSVEAIVGYTFENNVAVYGGFIQVDEDDSTYGSNVDEQFEVSTSMIGARYIWTKDVISYVEAVIDDSTNADGSKSDDETVFLGLKISL